MNAVFLGNVFRIAIETIEITESQKHRQNVNGRDGGHKLRYFKGRLNVLADRCTRTDQWHNRSVTCIRSAALINASLQLRYLTP